MSGQIFSIDNLDKMINVQSNELDSDIEMINQFVLVSAQKGEKKRNV